jgi:hypothetical protein
MAAAATSRPLPRLPPEVWDLILQCLDFTSLCFAAQLSSLRARLPPHLLCRVNLALFLKLFLPRWRLRDYHHWLVYVARAPVQWILAPLPPSGPIPAPWEWPPCAAGCWRNRGAVQTDSSALWICDTCIAHLMPIANAANAGDTERLGAALGTSTPIFQNTLDNDARMVSGDGAAAFSDVWGALRLATVEALLAWGRSDIADWCAQFSRPNRRLPPALLLVAQLFDGAICGEGSGEGGRMTNLECAGVLLAGRPAELIWASQAERFDPPEGNLLGAALLACGGRCATLSPSPLVAQTIDRGAVDACFLRSVLLMGWSEFACLLARSFPAALAGLCPPKWCRGAQLTLVRQLRALCNGPCLGEVRRWLRSHPNFADGAANPMAPFLCCQCINCTSLYLFGSRYLCPRLQAMPSCGAIYCFTDPRQHLVECIRVRPESYPNPHPECCAE